MNYIAVDDEPFALKDLEEALAEAAPDSVLRTFGVPSEADPVSLLDTCNTFNGKSTL